MISAATSATNSNVSASGETSSSEHDHHTRKGRAEERKPRFYVEIPTRNQRPGKERQRRDSHLSSAASSVGKSTSKPARTRAKDDRPGEPLVRTVSFDGVDEGDQESSVGLADDECVEASDEEIDDSKRSRMRTRRGSQVVPVGTVHALRSRTRGLKETSNTKQTPTRKGKGKAVARTKEDERDVEMEEVDSTEHEESDGTFGSSRVDANAVLTIADPTPRLRTNNAPVLSPTLKQGNMRTRQARRQSLLSSVSSSKSFELSSLPSQYASSEDSDEKPSSQASPRSNSALGMRRRTRGQARQHALENQLESMEITDEESAEQEDSVDQDMQDAEDQSEIVSEEQSVQDDDDDGDDEAEEFGEFFDRLSSPLLIHRCRARIDRRHAYYAQPFA